MTIITKANELFTTEIDNAIDKNDFIELCEALDVRGLFTKFENSVTILQDTGNQEGLYELLEVLVDAYIS